MSLMPHHSKQQRRGLLFGVGSLLAVSWMAGSLVSHRTHMEMDDTVKLEGWRIEFKTPVGWSEGSPQMDLRGGTVFAFSPVSDEYGSGSVILRVHRAMTTDKLTAREYCDDIIGQLTAIAGEPSPGNIRHSDSHMGDWPACFADVHEPTDLYYGMPGLNLRVLSAVHVEDHVTYAYAIEMQSAGPFRNRQEIAWDKIVKSVKTVGG